MVPASRAEKVHLVLGGGGILARFSGLLQGSHFWIDEDGEIVDGSPVSIWTDILEDTEATNTGANRPTGQANAGTGRIALLGNGTDQDLGFGLLEAFERLTIGILFEDPLTSAVVLIGGDSASDRLRVNTNGSVDLRAGGGSTATIAAAGSITANTPSMLMVLRGDADAITCRVNGVDVTDGTPSTSGTFAATHLMSRGNGDHMAGLLHSVIYHPGNDISGIPLIERLWNRLHNNVISLP